VGGTTSLTLLPGPSGRAAGPDSEAAQEAEYAAVEAAFKAEMGLVQAAA
jgi:hypothetical protein